MHIRIAPRDAPFRRVRPAPFEMTSLITELNARSRDIFRHIVEAFVETGGPIGSRTISKRLGSKHLNAGLSPASIRNVMADLEDLGLLYAPHVSAGRLPTELGLRLFVDGLLEVGRLSPLERRRIDHRLETQGISVEQALEEATATLSGLSGCAGLVLAPKTESPLKHIEFVGLGPGRVLVVLVTESGVVENRVIHVAPGIPPSALVEAGNYLNARLVGRTLAEARKAILREMETQRGEIDGLTSRLVEAGLAVWAGDRREGILILRGQAHLLEDINALEELERVRALFEALETKETLTRLLDLADHADGVQIFIGSDSKLFNLAGLSMIVAPFHDSRQHILGAIGVIGPTRLNYARIIPMVDYTSQVIGRLITEQSGKNRHDNKANPQTRERF
jgi:heat-inducible transcriptional repressor